MNDARSVLDEWNRLDRETAAEKILPCNGSHAWAKCVTAQRPIRSEEELFAVADSVWTAMPERDRQEAFDSHPRLGEAGAKAATGQSLSWSAAEQSAADPDERIRIALAETNRAYEEKFGRIFLLCATGRSAQEMLTILRARMQNDPATELQQAAEQQRLITRLRLRKWLGLPPLTCAELAAQTAAVAHT
jgi:2-oxo-4-hydroxy-4-carboxy-5-ureidoimidazoline decarboxylase